MECGQTRFGHSYLYSTPLLELNDLGTLRRDAPRDLGPTAAGHYDPAGFSIGDLRLELATEFGFLKPWSPSPFWAIFALPTRMRWTYPTVAA